MVKRSMLIGFTVVLLAIGMERWAFCESASGDLIGAEGIFKELQTVSTSETTAPEAPGKKEQFKQALDAFEKERSAIPPDKAAKEWLGLWERYWNTFPIDVITSSYYRHYGDAEVQGMPIEKLIVALPPPDAWPAIQKRIDNKDTKGLRSNGLRLIFAMLTGDAKGMDRELKIFKNRMDKQNAGTYFSNQTDSLYKFKSSLEGKNPSGETLPALEQLLDRLEKKKNFNSTRVFIPPIVSLAGEEHARRIITRFLMIPGLNLEITSDPETSKLARQTALANMDKLPMAQWRMVDTLDAVELFEALDKKFSSEEPVPDMRRFGYYNFDRNNRERDRAMSYYIFGLVAQGHLEKAISACDELSRKSGGYDMAYAAWREAKTRVSGAVLFDFLDSVLKKHPGFSWWSMYVEAGIQTGQSENVIHLLEETLQREDISSKDRTGAESALRECLLSVGKIDKAVSMIKAISKGMEDKEPEGSTVQSKRFRAAANIFEIGRLLKKEDLMEEGLSRMRELIESSMSEVETGNYDNRYYDIDLYVENLLKLGRLEEAEAFLLNVLSHALQPGPEKKFNRRRTYRRNSALLVLLAKLYHQADRPEDVLFLMDVFPWWGTKNVSYISDSDIQLHTAWALHRVGRNNEAAKILRAYLFVRPNYDPAYKLFCEVADNDAIDWLDRLYERDRFEERPLIWKAEMLRRAGDLNNAEKIIRQALKVDPTDGEQPAGSRVLAYKVLADILKAQGKEKDADFFYGVVKSVRVAEHGDELRRAGLVSMSLESYWKAASFFADAYCIQWRLAERLREQGDIEEAEKHYKIVFERMPEQFGQLASLCFGCEKVFGNISSQTTAERVLTGLLETSQKNRPQVHFLLGRLRMEQDKPRAAYEHFQKAIALDPDYLNAWQYIHSVRKSIMMAPEETQRVSFRLLELDPLRRHVGVDFNDIYDLKSLWLTLARYQQYNLEKPDSVYPLAASAKELDALRKKISSAGVGGMDGMESQRSYYRWPGVPEPGEALVSIAAICEAIELIKQAEQAKIMNIY